MIHYKKVLPEYFEDLASGKKKFELRPADWECKVGDVLILREYSGGGYTGRELRKTVSYVLKTKDLDFFSSQELEKFGYQILSLD